MPDPRAVRVVLSVGEREQLEAWARRRTSAQALALRSRVVLAAAEGLKNTEIAERLSISRRMAATWRSRFVLERLDGLVDEPRPGRPRTITDAHVEAVITRTLETTPKNATHWSTRSLAAQVGLSQTAVSRIWRAFGLQPHRLHSWKLSKDPLFIDKVRDVVGLYLAPPERAVVLCVDEKSQIQALDRTAPILPMLPGSPARATHDYTRYGTSSLYAALNLTDGKVISALHQRHRAIEFKKFLQRIDREVPAELAVHLVLDNSSTHKTPQIQRWLVAHPLVRAGRATTAFLTENPPLTEPPPRAPDPAWSGAWRLNLPAPPPRPVPDIDEAAHISGPAIEQAAVTAPMPGTVIKVLVAAGDRVSARQALVVLEAMKMETPLVSPYDATVRAVHVVEGDRVAGGTLLVELDD